MQEGKKKATRRERQGGSEKKARRKQDEGKKARRRQEEGKKARRMPEGEKKARRGQEEARRHFLKPSFCPCDPQLCDASTPSRAVLWGWSFSLPVDKKERVFLSPYRE